MLQIVFEKVFLLFKHYCFLFKNDVPLDQIYSQYRYNASFSCEIIKSNMVRFKFNKILLVKEIVYKKILQFKESSSEL